MISTGAPKARTCATPSQRQPRPSGPTHQPASIAVTQIVQTALRPDVEVDDLAELARVDPAFALRVIAFVNSPLIGLSKKIDDVRQACVLLGIRGLRNLALGLLVSGFDASRSQGNSVLLANCLRRALLARELGHVAGGLDCDMLFTTGLFLDVGLLVAAKDAPELALEMGMSPAPWRVTCERAAGLLPHPERGAQIARDYGVSEGVIDALIHHHDQEPPLNRVSATAWLAERCAGIFEGGDPEMQRRAVRDAAKKLGFDDSKVDGILATIPKGVVELAKVFDRDVGPQLEIAELAERVHDELANLNNRYEALVRSLEAIITEKQRLEEELRAANARLERLASTDELTGLLNRRALEDTLRRDLARADRDSTVLSILLLDIDHFKGVNDRWGHQAGDAVLTMVGSLLQRSLRASDAAGRYGGEEFMCLLPATDTTGARIVAERIRIAMMQQTVPTGGHFIQVSTSVGVASIKGPGCRSAFDSLVRQADENLYRAKAEGRNRVIG